MKLSYFITNLNLKITKIGHFKQSGQISQTVTILGNGVSLSDVREHLLKVVPGLEARGIGRDAVHFLLVPPRKNSTRACRYKGPVDAKIPRKRNDYREENQHFLFSRVAYREEFVTQHASESCFYSCDDMNKIKMGPSTAVSRYHQQMRLFINSDTPNFNDHDFPNPGYLIVCSGY